MPGPQAWDQFFDSPASRLADDIADEENSHPSKVDWWLSVARDFIDALSSKARLSFSANKNRLC
jgi:hypothetical protein